MAFKIEIKAPQVHLPFRLWIKDMDGNGRYDEFETMQDAMSQMERMLQTKRDYLGLALVELSDFGFIDGRWIVTGCIHASWGDYR